MKLFTFTLTYDPSDRSQDKQVLIGSCCIFHALNLLVDMFPAPSAVSWDNCQNASDSVRVVRASSLRSGPTSSDGSPIIH